MKKIVFTGGGTAGHVYPALALIDNFKDYEIHYIGGSGMEKDILKQYPKIIYHEIPTVKLERRLTLKNLLIPFKLSKSIKICKEILKEIQPNVVFSKGGFVAVPVAIATRKTHTPLISHESDLSLGLANKIILHYCKVMCTAFLKTAKTSKKCVYTGQPIREKIFAGNKARLRLESPKPYLLVLGGSTGAKFLNKLVYDNLDELTENFNVLHICGKNNPTPKYKNYLAVEYADNIEDFYARADVVISRAGSGVINELLALNKLMLLIPLSKKASRGDQIENAHYFKELGIAECVEEEEVTFSKILAKIKYLLKNKEKYLKKMKKIAKNTANKQIFEIIKKYELNT